MERNEEDDEEGEEEEEEVDVLPSDPLLSNESSSPPPGPLSRILPSFPTLLLLFIERSRSVVPKVEVLLLLLDLDLGVLCCCSKVPPLDEEVPLVPPLSPLPLLPLSPLLLPPPRRCTTAKESTMDSARLTS